MCVHNFDNVGRHESYGTAAHDARASACSLAQRSVSMLACPPQQSATQGVSSPCDISRRGLGFVVFGVVVTQLALWAALSLLWVVVLALGMLFGGSANANGAPSGQQGICDFGWTFADDTCFALIGGLDGQEAEWKTWPHTDAACQDHGLRLASVTSPHRRRTRSLATHRVRHHTCQRCEQEP